MDKSLFYIEPAAIHFSEKNTINNLEKLVSQFLDEFEILLQAMNDRKIRLVIDSVTGRKIFSESGEPLVPLPLSEISDPSLRGRINKLRQAFFAIIKPLALFVETETCSIMNENEELEYGVKVEPEEEQRLLDESDYCDFIHSLVGECYRNANSSDAILTLASFSKFKSKEIIIGCKCENSDFEKIFQCIKAESLINVERVRIDDLRQTLPKVKRYTRNEIIVTQAPHHPSAGRTNIQKYMDMSSQQRRVLDSLLQFGLYKLEIRDFGSHGGVKGDIRNCVKITEKSNNDHEIIEGWIISDDMSCKVGMYFQLDIGSRLIEILGNNFTYRVLLDLKDKLF